MSSSFPVPDGYAILNPTTLCDALARLPDVTVRLGGAPMAWRVSEVSDGNMNAVYLVEGPAGRVVAKQALPFIRAIGEAWPFPVSRIAFERAAMDAWDNAVPGLMPEVYAYDETHALLVMEALYPHVVLRHGLVRGEIYPDFPARMGAVLAQAIYATSDFVLDTPARQALAARFSGNAHLVATTENVVFTSPYTGHPYNRWTSPQLDADAQALKNDAVLLADSMALRHRFRTAGEALIHGDLHTGSIMVTQESTRVIDAEWAFFGPIGYDVGAVIGNLLLSFASQPGHATVPGERDRQAAWLLEATEAVWTVFRDTFSRLAMQGRSDEPGHAAYVSAHMRAVLADSLGFAGAKIIRRIIGISHVEDFEAIADPSRRAACERVALRLGRALVLERARFGDVTEVTALARRLVADASKPDSAPR